MNILFRKQMDVENKTEEVQDIIERMPTGWTFLVAAILFLLISGVVAMSFVIKYPDTVSGEISISAGKAPVRLVSNATGRLHLLRKNKSSVTSGNVLGYIESGASYEDVCRMEKLLNIDLLPYTKLSFPTRLKLGELSSDYNSFVLAYKEYDILRNTKSYSNIRSSLIKQADAARKVADNLRIELEINQRSLKNIYGRLLKDSVLREDGAISEEELNRQRNTYLTALQNNVSLKSSHLSKLAEIDQNRTEIEKINVTESEELKKTYMNMLAKKNVLSNNLERWLESYVIESPVAGQIEYLGFWRNNVYVSSSQELFSIIPEQDNPVGEVYIPISGAGKIEAGQTVNVKINDFPYTEYGLVKGRVIAKSAIPNKIKTNNGTTETYMVLVEFPRRLVTNYGKELVVNFEAKGRADIITKPRRLIERLFDNLKSVENK